MCIDSRRIVNNINTKRDYLTNGIVVGFNVPLDTLIILLSP